jgi:hypothetical protein
VPSPTSRQERFDQLSAEIDDLIARYPDMPPGRPQSICQREIDTRLRQIDELNAEQYAEEKAKNQQPHSAMANMRYPGVGLGMVLLAVGLLFSSYTLVAGGGAVILISLGVMGSGAPKPVQEPERPTAAHERFQWKP